MKHMYLPSPLKEQKNIFLKEKQRSYWQARKNVKFLEDNKLIQTYDEKEKQGLTLGQVVKVPCAPLQRSRFTGLDPGSRMTPLISHAVEAYHIQNRGRSAQMLAQGKSPSPKKKKQEREKQSKLP